MKVNLGRYPRKINGERKIKVQIDPWDIWSLDHTLAYIIHPALLELKKAKHGAPMVDDEDVPENLRSTAAPAKENEWETDDLFFDRWEWVLDEMIWAFAQILDDKAEDQFHSGEHDIQWRKVSRSGEVVDDKIYKMTDPKGEEEDDEDFLWEMVKGPNDTHVFNREGWDEWSKRKSNGFRLFGKYYQSLWD